jgi:hypothetical protein
VAWFTDPGFFGDERDIYNAAIIAVGEDALTEDSDGSTKAEVLCVNRYPKIRDSILRAHPWNCAMARSTLILNTTPTPDWGFDNQYDLPGDPDDYCLRVIRMSEDGAIYKVEGRLLLTDESPAEISYIKRVTNVELFDNLLFEAISAYLASILAFPVTKSRSLMTDMYSIYKDKIKEARRVDGVETGYSEPVGADLWLESRV